MTCPHCETDNVLTRDEHHASRCLGFDRWLCPTCQTSYPDGSPIIIRQR